MYIPKQVIIVNQAAPKTQPGGVHGAFINSKYQLEGTPLLVNNPPIASAPKFSAKNIISLKIIRFPAS